jgi:hypothetical protein
MSMHAGWSIGCISSNHGQYSKLGCRTLVECKLRSGAKHSKLVRWWEMTGHCSARVKPLETGQQEAWTVSPAGGSTPTLPYSRAMPFSPSTKLISRYALTHPEFKEACVSQPRCPALPCAALSGVRVPGARARAVPSHAGSH